MKKIFCIAVFFICNLSLSAHRDRWDAFRDKWSPLMLAIYSNQVDSVKRLISNGADVNYVVQYFNSDFRLPVLDVAIRIQNKELVKLLLSTNKIQNLSASLLTASADSSVAIVELLIKYGANPNDSFLNDYGPLIMATNFGSLEVVKCLLNHGADINHPRSGGMTPLMFAAFNGNFEKAKFLLVKGAYKNARDESGKRAYDFVDMIYQYHHTSDETKAELRELLK